MNAVRQRSKRGQFALTLTGLLTAGAVVRAPARAAQFEWKLAHGIPVEHPMHVRLVQMSKNVAAETNGQLVINVFPNGTLGGQAQLIPQLRALNAIQMIVFASSAGSGLVPDTEIDVLPLAFPSTEVACKVLDGELGEYIRQAGFVYPRTCIFMLNKKFDYRMRQMTSGAKPLRTLDDFGGFKVATSIAKLSVDFFRSIGASPVALPAEEWYTSLQTHIVDGSESALQIIETFRWFEGQRFLAMTNHQWSSSWTAANLATWNSIPGKFQEIVLRNHAKCVDLEPTPRCRIGRCRDRRQNAQARFSFQHRRLTGLAPPPRTILSTLEVELQRDGMELARSRYRRKARLTERYESLRGSGGGVRRRGRDGGVRPDGDAEHQLAVHALGTLSAGAVDRRAPGRQRPGDGRRLGARHRDSGRLRGNRRTRDHADRDLAGRRQPGRARSPVVVLAGDVVESDEMQRVDQRRVAETLEAGYVRLSPDHPYEDVRKAFNMARVESRPVVLAAAIDVQNMEYEGEPGYAPSQSLQPGAQRSSPDKERLREAARIVSASKRPVIIAGRGAIAADAGEAIRRLARRIGALIATSLLAKGWLAGEDDFYAGISGLFSPRAQTELFAQSDCVIGVGASLNHYTTEAGYLFPDARFIHIDASPQIIMGNGRVADCYVQADARAAIEELEALLASQGFSWTGYRTPEVRAALTEEIDPATFDLDPGTLDPRRVCDLLDERIPGELPVVLGSGHFMAFPVMHMNRPRAHPIMTTLHFGTIGQGLGTAMGVAVGTPRATRLVEGDASTMMCVQELDTAARYRIPLLTIVFNDESWGAEYHKLRAQNKRTKISEVATPDIGAVATALGCRGRFATSLEAVDRAVEEFLTEPGPMLVDVRVSRNVTSIPYRRAHYGVPACPKGRDHMGTRVAVVGLGAIGGQVGASLVRGKEDVVLIDQWPENVEHIRKHGIKVDGMTPQETYSIPAFHALNICDVQELSKGKPIDVVMLSVKSYDTVWATAMIKPYLAEDGFVCSMQNCINEEKVASVVGWGKTLGAAGRDARSAELVGPGHVVSAVRLHDLPFASFQVGEVHGRVTPRAEEVAAALLLHCAVGGGDDEPVGTSAGRSWW